MWCWRNPLGSLKMHPCPVGSKQCRRARISACGVREVDDIIPNVSLFCGIPPPLYPNHTVLRLSITSTLPVQPTHSFMAHCNPLDHRLQCLVPRTCAI